MRSPQRAIKNRKRKIPPRLSRNQENGAGKPNMRHGLLQMAGCGIGAKAAEQAMPRRSRRTAKDRFTPRMAVNMTPQDSTTHAPRVDQGTDPPRRKGQGSLCIVEVCVWPGISTGHPSEDQVSTRVPAACLGGPASRGEGESRGRKSAEMRSTAMVTSKD